MVVGFVVVASMALAIMRTRSAKFATPFLVVGVLVISSAVI